MFCQRGAKMRKCQDIRGGERQKKVQGLFREGKLRASRVGVLVVYVVTTPVLNKYVPRQRHPSRTTEPKWELRLMRRWNDPTNRPGQ